MEFNCLINLREFVKKLTLESSHKFNIRIHVLRNKELEEYKIQFLKSLKELKEKDQKSLKNKKNIEDFELTFDTLYTEANKILESCKPSIEEIEDNTSSSGSYTSVTSESNTMSDFKILEYVKIIPFFNGEKEDEFPNFIGLIEFLYNSLENAEDKKKLIDFVLIVKISQNVKNKLCQLPKPPNFQILKENFETIFSCHKNPLKLHSELAQEFQGNRSIKEFATSIETLVSQLNSVQIRDQGEENRTIICKLNDGIALNSFKNGIQNLLKPTVFAAQPKTFSEAVKLAEQIEVTSSNNISNFRSRNPNQNRGQNSYNNQNRGFNNNRSRFNTSNNNNINNRHSYNNYIPPNNNFRRTNTNNYRSNHNASSFNRNDNNRYHQRRVNTTNSGNELIPDQNASGQNQVQY